MSVHTVHSLATISSQIKQLHLYTDILSHPMLQLRDSDPLDQCPNQELADHGQPVTVSGVSLSLSTCSTLASPTLCSQPSTVAVRSHSTPSRLRSRLCDWGAIFFQRTPFSLGRKVTDKLWFCRLEYLAGVTKMNKIICHFKENN